MLQVHSHEPPQYLHLLACILHYPLKTVYSNVPGDYIFDSFSPIIHKGGVREPQLLAVWADLPLALRADHSPQTMLDDIISCIVGSFRGGFYIRE